MSTFTPGPWSIVMRKSWSGNELYFDGVADPTGEKIRVEGLVLTASPVGRANARLIAAAPELLAALRSCLQCFDEMKGRKPAFVEDSIAMGKEAVAKATGAE